MSLTRVLSRLNQVTVPGKSLMQRSALTEVPARTIYSGSSEKDVEHYEKMHHVHVEYKVTIDFIHHPEKNVHHSHKHHHKKIQSFSTPALIDVDVMPLPVEHDHEQRAHSKHKHRVVHAGHEETEHSKHKHRHR